MKTKKVKIPVVKYRSHRITCPQTTPIASFPELWAAPRRRVQRGLQETERSLDHKTRALPLNGCSGEPFGEEVSTHRSDDESRDTCSKRSKIHLIRGP